MTDDDKTWVYALILLLVVGVIGAVGWYLWSSRPGEPPPVPVIESPEGEIESTP